MNDDFEKIIASIDKSLNSINLVKNDQEMDETYSDPYTTKQQKYRDEAITELLKCYVDSYKSKVNSNKKYKFFIFTVCMIVIVAFSFIVGLCIYSFASGNASADVQDWVSLITVCLTYITLVIGILQTITKYVFPENDEAYVTKIVEIIQNNDLENKKENIRVNDKKSE